MYLKLSVVVKKGPSRALHTENAAELHLITPRCSARKHFISCGFLYKQSAAPMALTTISTHLFCRFEVFCISQVEKFMVLIMTEVVIYHLLGEK